MADTLRVLIVEDVPTDAELMEYELQNARMDFFAQRVETKEAYSAALSTFLPDVILSDYSLPAFDGITALQVRLERAPDIPFIFVSGALGEELAIDLLKQGATDYVLKSRLARLPVAVSRALREVEERKEREQAQAALRQTEELLRKVATAVEQAAEGVMITDSDGNVEYVNPAFTRISGYAEADIIGRESTLLRSDRHPGAFYDSLWHTVKTGDVWKGRIVRKKKDGSVYDMEETISPVKDRFGAIVNVVFVGRDVTEQIRLEEQLRHAHKMEAIGTLAGGVAHDFNNILAAMIGFTQAVLDDVSDKPRVQHKMKQVVKAGLRGRDLVRQILTFSRKSEGERTEVSLTPLIKETHGLLRATLPSSIRMALDLTAIHDTVLADPTQLQQVLMNLATNGAHAMGEEGGRLVIRLSSVTFHDGSNLPDTEMEPGSYAKITVEDTGIGMAPEVRQRIFEPFFTTKAPGQGTGMGLAVAYGIVKAHGGAISVQSGPGQGSIFEVFLPMKPEVTEEEIATSALPTGTERILFVDDEYMLLDTARDMLGSLGYRVLVALNGSEAWNLFLADPWRFDLVITDQVMPDITGLTLARKMLKVRKELPLILLTGYSDLVSAEKAKEAGVGAFLMKPVVKKELAEAVRRVLDTKNA